MPKTAEKYDDIPNHESLMLPLLHFAASREEFCIPESVEAMAEEFQLTPEQLLIRYAHSRQRVFRSRISWTLAYLKKSGLLQSVSLGKYAFTDEGWMLLAESPERVDTPLLKQRYPVMTPFLRPDGIKKRGASKKARKLKALPDTAKEKISNTVSAPLALLPAADEPTALEVEILQEFRRLSSVAFENIVMALLMAMGYDAANADLQQTGPGKGLSGLVTYADPLEIKRATYVRTAYGRVGNVGAAPVRKLIKRMEGSNAGKGVLITQSDFTAEAEALAKEFGNAIALISGKKLASLMIQQNVGVDTRSVSRIADLNAVYGGKQSV